jgi:hypothetical protein
MARAPSLSRHRFGGNPPGEDTDDQERGKTAARDAIQRGMDLPFRPDPDTRVAQQ